MRIRFYLHTYKRKDGKRVIMCAYSHASLEWRFSTGIAIEAKAWAQSAQQVKRTHPDAATINASILEPIRQRLRSIAIELQAHPDPVSPLPDRVRRRYESRDENSDFWRRFSDFEAGRVATLAANTRKNYRHLREFLKEIESKAGPLSWSSFDLQFYELFRIELRRRGNNENTIAKRVANLKAFLRYGHRAGWHDNDKFQYFETAREKTTHIALTEAELLRIESLPFNSQGLDRARDVFVFQCYVGCRYSDLSRIEYLGEGRIRFRSQKTGTDQALEINTKARSILEKYDGALPVVSGQKYNKHIKTICREAGIEAHKKCTSHTARRTCATMLYRRGVDLRRIQAVLGHSSIKQTEKYLKATEADFESTLTRFDS